MEHIMQDILTSKPTAQKCHR